MKKQLLLLLAFFLSLSCYAQTMFENGYYIDDADQKVECLIKNIDWRNNPTEFIYQLSEGGEPKTATIKSIKEFGIYNVSKYVRSTVNIDRSSLSTSNLSTDRNPVFSQEVLFLKVLVEGKATLYEYIESSLRRYFYSTENSAIEQLIFKRYKIDDSINENNGFRQQLFNALKCSSFTMQKTADIGYNKKELTRLFVEYSECHSEEIINFGLKQKKDLFNLNIRPRLTSSSLKIDNSVANSLDTDFGSKMGFAFGIEAEFILPYNNNKWAIAIEPTYQGFKAEKATDPNNISGGDITAMVQYNSIEIPLSLRHYFFLDANSKFFLNGSGILDININSSRIEFQRTNITDIVTTKSRISLAFGGGYKLNDKYSLELRYLIGREVLSNLGAWNTSYKKLSVVFGYTIF